ncbi:MAG: XRN 5'-3' exonuclease [Dasosvirus sp.]|uniref:XRN 5'-3' exonuclease n=1 Tax=Dasosvirus sp. TaxID=2487764 RepID=A0A3G4ZU80_9VIRU|nr:MAG: XRN 5'-3' exonuclease [Dasosvirus sp.]
MDKDGQITINNKFLVKFITLLSLQEEDFFCRILPKHLEISERKKCFDREQYKREIWQIEHLKNIKSYELDRIRLGDGRPEEWKYRYYSHYFRTDEHMKETVDNICHNYLEGLLWVARYYFEECPSWRWQYKYTHAPFLSDIREYLKDREIMRDFNIESRPNISMYSQLLSVIPPQYSEILPPAIRHLNSSAKSPIIDMFPLRYEIDMINKTVLYKCIPMIPYLDIDRIDREIAKVKFDRHSLERCKLEKAFVIKSETRKNTQRSRIERTS